MDIVPIYASLLGLFLVVLSIRVIYLRRKLKLALGDAGNLTITKAIRAQSNFAEYVPLALLLLFFLENTNAPILLLHVLCLTLLIGRLIHAYGISQPKEKLFFRITGMLMTFSTIIITSLSLIFLHFLSA